MLNGDVEKKGAENMTHAETVAALRGLGIEIPEKAVEETEAFLASERAIWGDALEEEYDFPANLLMSVGIGRFDDDVGFDGDVEETWKPSSSDVYAFNTYFYSVDTIWRPFFRGLAAIIPGFEPTDIHGSVEERVQDDFVEDGGAPAAEGKATISFVLNGERYEWKIDFCSSWFDEKALAALANDVLEQRGFEGRVYAFTDGWDGVILLYGDEAYGKKLREIIPQPVQKRD